MSHTVIHAATDKGLVSLHQQNGGWRAALALEGKDCRAVVVDPHRPQRLYCATFGDGLWASDDAGASWQPTASAVPHAEVMAVAVSPLTAVDGCGVLWAGTEPSALFRSEDGGRTWREHTALRELPSSSTWSFPPRPWTHHVRWIEPDVNVADRLFVGIELGGVMRSLDGGETWADRKPNSQHDCHTLRTHAKAPGLLYETAGGGFAESHDGGATWQRHDDGMQYHYLWGLAVDPAEPKTVVVSASPGARGAHNDQHAEATLYRRSGGDATWRPVYAGLPDPSGTRAYVLATNSTEPGVFYAAMRNRFFRSADAGQTWRELPIEWPADASALEVMKMTVTETE